MRSIIADMEKNNLKDAGSKQLDRVLGFFPRVETKISALFAVDAAMLGLLALNTKLDDVGIWYLAIFEGLAMVGLGVSLWYLYKASYPQLEGGQTSLVYFREIASRTEAQYIQEMKECDEAKYEQELLGQVWRNSEILKMKFDALKQAFIYTALSIPAWFLALMIATVSHAELAVK